MHLSNKSFKAIGLISLFITLFLSSISQINFELIKIDSGTYVLGKKDHTLNPLHTVEIKYTFYISNLEISNAQFQVFVDSTGYITDAEKLHNAMIFVPGLKAYEWLEDSTAQWRFPNGVERGGIQQKMNHPVTCISYRDAEAYCKWANVRLPTLDEWEIAARCGTHTDLFFGTNKKEIIKYANIWNGKNHLKKDTVDDYTYTSPVGSFKPNGCGLYDMYGNVFEFCKGKTALVKKFYRVVCARGGSWWCSSNTCNYFNSVDIGRVHEVASFSNQGFRVAKDF